MYASVDGIPSIKAMFPPVSLKWSATSERNPTTEMNKPLVLSNYGPPCIRLPPSAPEAHFNFSTTGVTLKSALACHNEGTKFIGLSKLWTRSVFQMSSRLHREHF